MSALLMSVVLIILAAVVDLGLLRTSAQLDQSVADFAALAAGTSLASHDPEGACKAAIGYLDANAPGITAIDADSFCAQSGNDPSRTVCTPPNSAPQAAPTITAGKYTVTIHYPVPDSEIADPLFGAGLHDGGPCDRFRVIVSATQPALFGGVVGANSYSATRSATIKIGQNAVNRTPALWMLDPFGCTSLGVSGGSQLTIGATSPSVVPGVITIDSDGSKCAGSQTTVSVSGAGTSLTAVPTNSSPSGSVNLFALAPGATTCSTPACSSADVSSGRLSPQPAPSGQRATRAAVDWRYNCKTSYPAYHTVTIAKCPDTASVAPYLDNLVTAVGASGNPGSYQRWTTTGHSCNAPGATVVSGNWWVDCPAGLSIGNGSAVTFSDGNVILDGGLSMNGSGILNVNTANGVAHLPSSCLPPLVVIPCINQTSAAAALLYVRSGDINITGGTFTVNHAVTVLRSGVLKVAGGAPPSWSAPTEGPFAGLALWAEASSNKFQLNGGASAQLSGTFFTPEAAPFSLAGGGNWGQQHAQFISYQLAVSGGGILALAPDPATAVQLPPIATKLIR